MLFTVIELKLELKEGRRLHQSMESLGRLPLRNGVNFTAGVEFPVCYYVDTHYTCNL
jgi:hypothetical protein